MRTVLLFFLFLTNFGLQAQSWSPSGATWYYTYLTVFPYAAYVKIAYEGDTVVGPDTLKKLEKYRIGYDFMSSSYFNTHYGTNLTKEEDSIVYLYNQVSAELDTLYNFKAHPGDHWQTIHAVGCNGTVYVLNTGTRNIHGQNLKWLRVKTFYDFSYGPTIDTIYQKMGPKTGIETNDYCQWDTSDGNETGPFRCYSDDAFGTYSASIHSCDYIMSENDLPLLQPKISLFPNPFQAELTIENHSSTALPYVLKDVQGKILLNGTLYPGTNRMDTGNMSKGLYFLFSNGSAAVKLIRE